MSWTMDTITQGLLGAVTAQLGFRQRIGRGATWAAAGVAILPDLDILVVPLLELTGSEVPETAVPRYHRGLSHSLLMVPVLAAAAAGAWWCLRRRRRNRPGGGANADPALAGQRGPPGFGWLYACCFVAALTHPLLDWCTSYGTQILAPLTDRRYAIDVVPILDIFYTPLLMLTLAACWLVRKLGGRRAALAVGWCGFALSVGYLAAGRVMHDLVVRRARGLVPPEQRVLRVDAYPSIGSIFLWRGVVEPDGAWLAARLRPWPSSRPRVSRVAKIDNEWVRRARSLAEARAFEWFTMGRMRASWEKLNGQHVVEFHDMRYAMQAEDAKGLWTLRVRFDAGGNPLPAQWTRHHRRGGFRKLAGRMWRDLWAP
jgi:inner membrane protein